MFYAANIRNKRDSRPGRVMIISNFRRWMTNDGFNITTNRIIPGFVREHLIERLTRTSCLHYYGRNL